MIYNFDQLNFQILTIDRYKHRNGLDDVGGRPFAALSFRTGGFSEFEVMNKKFTVAKGDVLFLPANVPYKVRNLDSESIVIHMSECNYHEAEYISLSCGAAIELSFNRLLDAWTESRSPIGAKARIYSILEKMGSEIKNDEVDISVMNCVRFMEERLSDPELDINDVCRHGYVSISGLRRSFIRHFGLSPGQYLINMRMNKALDLLSDGNLSIKEVAISCGFSDEKYFSRSFKSRYGYPPSQLRKRMPV